MYRRRQPPPNLAPFVESLWLQEAPPLRSPAVARPTRVVPGVGVELIVCHGAPFESIDASDSRPMPVAHVSGPRTRALSVRATGETGMVIARLHPWAARAFLGPGAAELVDENVPVGAVDASENAMRLHEAVSRAATAAERLARVTRYLEGRLLRSSPDPLVVEGVRRIAASWGRVSVAGLARELSISRRQLHRRFVDATGLGVKRLSRLVRFQKALGCLRAGESWDEVVWRCGYADQSPLISESRAFVGETPAAVARSLTTPLMRYFNARSSGRLNTTTYL